MENATRKVFVSVFTDFLEVIAPFVCAPPAMRSVTWQKLLTRLTKMQSVVEGINNPTVNNDDIINR
jgi:hypothetical protein